MQGKENSVHSPRLFPDKERELIMKRTKPSCPLSGKHAMKQCISRPALKTKLIQTLLARQPRIQRYGNAQNKAISTPKNKVLKPSSEEEVGR